ncbi:MAG: glycosyltransferase [Oscillospiraceae bacterium]|nr:glycosyltransferase [Oscillospiraceae bacterium]
MAAVPQFCGAAVCKGESILNKYKIAVYAIAKNEEKFIDRWVKSMSEADEIVVLDTGSTDSTLSLLSKYEKVRVYSEIISPWRFDTARNRALSFVSDDADICVSTDIDEIFEPGWRERIEKCLSSGATQVRYRYTWNFNPDGSEGTVFFGDKIHKKKGFVWRHPVHEVIKFEGEYENKVVADPLIRLYHRADNSKSRAQYLPLLELSVKEDPSDDRNTHYLAREYYFRREYEKAVEFFLRHLDLPSATWADERCASMRYIAKCKLALNQEEEAGRWYMRACAEAPYVREPWLEFAYFCYDKKNYHAAVALINEALKITSANLTYISDSLSFSERPYDILSLCYFFLGDKKNALINADKALEISPDNERIRQNRLFYLE